MGVVFPYVVEWLSLDCHHFDLLMSFSAIYWLDPAELSSNMAESGFQNVEALRHDSPRFRKTGSPVFAVPNRVLYELRTRRHF